ncbi:hypothetical protein [Kitasatospora sp. NPDC088346]|uniref:hypothetical protein n=1 Tax=Kitasatospora sp. NPDC088346 TaxID=3364073 RepID=UPI003802D82A
MDESYLNELCGHLTGSAPLHGDWITSARSWAAAPDGRVRGAWLRILSEPHRLYRAALDAALPLPLEGRDSGDPWLHVVQDNALAAVLAVHAAFAVTAPRNEAHQAGGPSIGSVLGEQHKRGAVHAASLDATVASLARGGRDALIRTVSLAGRARGSRVDLRTVAALAYSRPGQARPHLLTTNPTGHWPNALASRDHWSPLEEIVRDALSARQR